MPGFFPMQYALKPKPSPYIRTASERVVPHALRSVADKAGQKKNNQGGYQWEEKPSNNQPNLFNKRSQEDEDFPDEPKKDSSCDLKTVLRMSADAKADWLDASLWSVEQKKLKPIEVYDIVTHPKFGSGANKRCGQRMVKYIDENIFLFSVKQRDSLYNCKLYQDYKVHPNNNNNQKEQTAAATGAESDGEKSRSRSRSRSKSPTKAKRPKTLFERPAPVQNYEEERMDNLIEERHRIFAQLKQESSSLPDDTIIANAAHLAAAFPQVPLFDAANSGVASTATSSGAPRKAKASKAMSSSANTRVSSILAAFPDAAETPGSAESKGETEFKKDGKVVSNILSGLLVGKVAPSVVEDPRKKTVIKTTKPPSLEALKPTRDDLTEVAKPSRTYAHASMFPPPRPKMKPGAICYLCKRAFSCKEMLHRHEQKSELHKKNYDRYRRNR